MPKTDNLPTLAVVIPNRNDSTTLPVCLGSVLNQTVRPDQIIFIDDQSDDCSLALAGEILNGISGVQIIANQTWLGTVGTINEGLKRVTSDYVLFLSSNDYLIDRIFEKAKHSIATVGSTGVWSAMVWIADKHDNPLYIYPTPMVKLNEEYISPEECIQLAIKFGNWFTGTTLFFHRKTLQAIGGLDEDYKGLADLLAALTIASIKGAFFLPKAIGVMRLHTGGYLWKTLSNLENLRKNFIRN